jgi:hypothetical protein
MKTTPKKRVLGKGKEKRYGEKGKRGSGSGRSVSTKASGLLHEINAFEGYFRPFQDHD